MKSGGLTLEEYVLGGEVQLGVVVRDGLDPLQHPRRPRPPRAHRRLVPEQVVHLLLVAEGTRQDFGGGPDVQAGQDVEDALEVIGHVRHEGGQMVQNERDYVQNDPGNLDDFFAVGLLGGGRGGVGQAEGEDHLRDALAHQLGRPSDEIPQQDQQKFDEVRGDLFAWLSDWNRRWCTR